MPEKISRYLGSSIGESRQDKVSDDPTETQSDSGDSLFITQNPMPEAVRSVKRRHSRLRPDATPPREEEESEDDCTSPVSQRRSVLSSPARSSKSGKERRGGKGKCKNYCFPFLAATHDAKHLSSRERRRRGTKLTLQQNASLRKFAIGCFFKCVQTMWENRITVGTLESLPVIDMDKEGTISPLSEEDEKSDDEDIRVVETKLFAQPFKAKSSLPGSNDSISVKQVKRPRRERAHVAGQVTSQQAPQKTPQKSRLTKTRSPKLTGLQLCPEIESSVDRDSSHRGSVSRRMDSELMTSDSDSITDALNVKRRLTRRKKRNTRENGENVSHQNSREEHQCIVSVPSSSTSCEPFRPQRSPVTYSQQDREACDEVKGMEKTLVREDSSAVEEGMELSSVQEQPEGQDAGTCVDNEITEVEETPLLFEDKTAERSGPHTNEEMGLGEKNKRKESLSHDDKTQRQEESSIELPQNEDDMNQRDDSQIKGKKKRRKKNKSAVDAVTEEGLEKGASDYASLHSKQIDQSSSQVLSQVSETTSCHEIAAVSPRPLAHKISVQYAASPLKKARDEDEVGNLESNVRMEEVAVFSESYESPVASDGKESRKKKRKRVPENDEDVELCSDAAARPPNDDEVYSKKKKRKKEKRDAVTQEQESEVALNLNLDPPVKLKGLLEESGWSSPTLRPGQGPCLENTEVSQESSESPNAKNSQQSMRSSVPQLEDVMEPRKKSKKKQQLSCNDDAKAGQEEEDVTPSNDAMTPTALSTKKKKEKRKNRRTDTSNTAEATEINPNDKSQKTNKSSAGQDAELVSKKTKKKKTVETSVRDISEDTVAQTADSVSVREKEKKGATSFPVDDTVEKDAETHQEDPDPSRYPVGSNFESDDRVRKKEKKRKRKTSASQDSMVKEHEDDFEMPNKRLSSEPETTDTVVKKKKKHKKIGRELETPADMGYSLTDETAALKKKCKDADSAIEANTPTTVENVKAKQSTLMDSSSASHEERSRPLSIPLDPQSRRENVANMSETDLTFEAEHASESNKKKKKKKKKCAGNVSAEEELLPESVEMEPHARKKKHREEKERDKRSEGPKATPSGPMVSESNSPPSDLTDKKKHIKAKRRLLNPYQDFLDTDF